MDLNDLNALIITKGNNIITFFSGIRQLLFQKYSFLIILKCIFWLFLCSDGYPYTYTTVKEIFNLNSFTFFLAKYGLNKIIDNQVCGHSLGIQKTALPRCK